MARSSTTAQAVTRAGLNPAYTAPSADGDILDAGTFLHVKNGGGSQITVTVETTATYDGLPVGNLSVTVPATSERFIGPFLSRTFAQNPGATVGAGRVLVNYSGITSVTRAVLSV